MSNFNVFKSKFIKRSSGIVHYIAGQQENPRDDLTLIFIHGFPETSYGWLESMSYFYAQGFNVLAVDLRGIFLSQGFRKRRDYTFEAMAEDLAILIKACVTRKVVVIGHDLGGVVAWSLAKQNLNKTVGFVILNCPDIDAFALLIRRQPLFALLQGFRFWYIGLFQIPLLSQWVLSIGHKLWYQLLFKKHLPSQLDKVKALTSTYASQTRTANDFKKAILPYRANLFYGYGPSIMKRVFKQKQRLKSTVPILCCWGDRDNILDNRLFDQKKYLNYENIEINCFRKTKHYIQHQASEKFNSDLLKWLRGKKIVKSSLNDVKSLEEKYRDALEQLYAQLIEESAHK